jgi:hypothetical protein
MASASDIIQEVLSIVAPGLVGTERDKLAASIERLISVALRSMAVSLSKSDDTSISTLVSQWYNVTTDSNGQVDLTSYTTQAVKPIILSIPFLKVRSDSVPEGELFPMPDIQTLNNKPTDEGLYYYTVESLTFFTRGGDDGSPLVTTVVRILAPFVPNIVSINDTLRPYLITEILNSFSDDSSGNKNGGRKK